MQDGKKKCCVCSFSFTNTIPFPKGGGSESLKVFLFPSFVIFGFYRMQQIQVNNFWLIFNILICKACQ